MRYLTLCLLLAGCLTPAQRKAQHCDTLSHEFEHAVKDCTRCMHDLRSERHATPDLCAAYCDASSGAQSAALSTCGAAKKAEVAP